MPSSIENPNGAGSAVSVIGLGKLGAPLAACLAAKGRHVIAVDVDPAKVEAVNQRRAPVFEPGLEEMIAASDGRLRATRDITEAVAHSAITFIVVATPSEPNGTFSLRYALDACKAIGQALRAKRDFHIVVVTSTVMPGSTDGPIREALEQASGRRAGQDFGLCYNPEFIALGSVIRDFLNPDFVLIGESDGRSGSTLEVLYREICDSAFAVARMTLVNAEITKLSVNTFVTTKISFANMLARMCERVPGASVNVVTSALGLDSRIGAKYLKGAVSYGGPCFPRDNLALAAFAHSIGAPADLAEATHRFNCLQIDLLAGLVTERLRQGGRAGILGLTYKPNTDVVEQSVGCLLAQQLVSQGVSVIACDPAGNAHASRALGAAVTLLDSPEQCVQQSDVVVVATPWQQFRALTKETWARPGEPRVVIDCWRSLGFLDGCMGVAYLALGNFQSDSRGASEPLRQGVQRGRVSSNLSLFAIPKHFRGHIATIQRNAIASWTLLRPRPEILLFGNEEGTAEIARELGLLHVPQVARNEFGTPLVNDVFRQAQERATAPLVGYVNADIILTADFTAAVARARAMHEKFLAVGRRWDVDWDQPLEFSQPGWSESIRERARAANVQRPGNFIDYFVFPRGLYRELLPLAVGRFSWDNYLLWYASAHGATLLDLSPVVMAVHQNHDYGHSSNFVDVRQGPEPKRNRAMVGPWWHMYTIEDSTQILTEDGVRPSHLHWRLMAKRLWSHPLTIFQLPWLGLKRLLRV